jgi:hypothetical protein
VLALLAGASPAPCDAPPIESGQDVLALLGGEGSQGATAPTQAAPPAVEVAPLAEDGTLAGLIGAAGLPEPAAPAPGDADPLLALIDAGAPPGGAETADLLPETVALPWPPAAEPEPPPCAAFVPPAVAPPAPEGGGWWTRGGAQVPPMVWPLPTLPATDEFAYLLEAAA